jgi:hypothetical protein
MRKIFHKQYYLFITLLTLLKCIFLLYFFFYFIFFFTLINLIKNVFTRNVYVTLVIQTHDKCYATKINNTCAKYYSLISMQDKPTLHLKCVEVKGPQLCFGQ